MSLSLGSTGVNYSMLDEIWDNYKYPKQNDYSCTGYDSFNDYSFNDNVYGEKQSNIQGQAVLANKRPKVIENFKSQPMSFEGFQASPMDHPSTSKGNVENTYDHRPYDKNDIYSPVNANEHRRLRCDEYMDHIRQCHQCYEHIRNNLDLGQNTYTSPLQNINLNNLNFMNLALIFVGGAFCLLLLDILLTIRKK